nr:MAG TPA: hypothetical protein [Caudoviricetes sp.]
MHCQSFIEHKKTPRVRQRVFAPGRARVAFYVNK